MTGILFAVELLGGCGSIGEPPEASEETAPPPTPTESVQFSELSARRTEPLIGPIDVAWTQDVAADVRIEYDVAGETRSTPIVEAIAGENRATVIGVPLGTTAPWRLVAATESGQAEAAEALEQWPVPPTMPVPLVRISDPGRYDPESNYILVSINERADGWSGGRYWLMIVDREGRPVWATRTSPGPDKAILYAQISAAGDSLLWDEIVWDDTEASVAHRAYLDAPIEDIGIPGHHHAMMELSDGTIAWAAEDAFTERLLELAPDAVAPTEVWSCADWPVANGCLPARSNSIWYDERSDAYVYSWWSMDAIVEVDRTDGTSTWWSPGGEPGDIEPGGDGAYTFADGTLRFWWPHGLQVLANGHLLVSTDVSRFGSTRVAEYAIDRVERELTEVWSYDPGYRARFNGDTRRLGNGNTLHGLGARSILYEVTPEGDVVWEALFANDRMLGRADLIDDLYDLTAPRQAP